MTIRLISLSWNHQTRRDGSIKLKYFLSESSHHLSQQGELSGTTGQFAGKYFKLNYFYVRFVKCRGVDFWKINLDIKKIIIKFAYPIKDNELWTLMLTLSLAWKGERKKVSRKMMCCFLHCCCSTGSK